MAEADLGMASRQDMKSFMPQLEKKYNARGRVTRSEEKQWARNQGKSKRKLHWETRQCNVVLTDIKYDKSLTRDGDIYIISDERKKNHTCYICMAKFSSLSDLGIHKKLHIDSDVEDDLFEEEYGGKSWSSPSKDSSCFTIDEKVKNLDVLVRVPDKKTVLPMEKATLQNDKAKSIANSPDKIKPPFKCVVCDQYFETSDEAKRHLPKVAKEKCKFSCHLCNRKFNTLYAFVVHMMQHKTNIVKNQLSSRSIYTCSICDKTFSDCFQLKRHEITTHKKKTVSQSQQATSTSNATEPTVSETMVTEENEQAENDFTCELCYDIFTTKEELDSHTDFHKQLERISEPVITDDVSVTVEIIEDHTDKHEIITTIQKAQSNSLTRKTNTINRTYDKFTLAPDPSISTVPKQKLTAKIKEMIAPKSAKTDVKQKPSKTIFLPNVQPRSKGKPGPKPKQKTLRKTTALEVQRTSPTSFSVVYTEANNPSPSTSIDVSSNLPPLLPKPSSLAHVQPKTDGNVAKDGTRENKVPISRYISPMVELGSAQVHNTSLACSSAPGLLMNPVSNPGLSYLLNPSVPIFTSQSLNANTVVSLSNSNSIATASVAPSNAPYAYVVVPTSMSPNVSTPNAVPNLSNVNNLIPAVNDAPHQQFSTNITHPFSDPPPVPPQFQQNDSTGGGMTMPIIYNVMSLNESAKPEMMEIDEENTVPQVKPDSLGPPENSIDTIGNTKMSNYRPILPAAVPSAEIICLDSDSDTEGTANESAAPAPPNDSDEEENLVIDDEAANQGGVELSNTAGGGSAKQVLDAVSDSKDEAGDDETDKNGESGKQEGEKKWNFPIKCQSCNVKFKRYRSMRLHNERKVTCNECQFKCCRTIELKNHYLSKHRIFYCWRCNFQTKLQGEFVDHRKFHTCETCGGVFVEMSRHNCKKNKKAEANGSDSPIMVSE